MTRPKMYAGIDPGADGFLTLMDPSLDSTHQGKFVFFSFDKESPYVIADAIRKYSTEYDLTVTMEEVHSVFGSSAKSNFSFGFNVGVLTGILIANAVRFVKVQPKEWQKEVWINADKVKESGKVNTKKTSVNAAQRLFPTVDLRKTGKSKTAHDGKADSLLICEYGRRRNL